MGLESRQGRVLRSQWARMLRQEKLLPLVEVKLSRVSSRWESGLLKPRLLSCE